MQRSKKEGFDPRTHTGLDLSEVRDLIATKTCVIQREESEFQRKCARLVRERRLFGIRLAIIQLHGITNWRCGQRLNEGRFLLLNLVKCGPTDEIWHAMDIEKNSMCSLRVAGSELWARMSEQERSQVTAEIEAHKCCYSNLVHNRVRHCEALMLLNGRPCIILKRSTADEPKDLEHYLITNGPFSEREVRSVVLQVVSALLKFRAEGIESLGGPNLNDISYVGGEVHVTPPFPRILSAYEISFCALLGNLRHLPPEVRSKLPQNMNSSKVESWALGVLAYRLLFDQLPVSMKKENRGYWARDDETLSFTPSGVDKPRISKGCELFLQNLLSNETRRPTLVEVAADPYLTTTQRLPSVSGERSGLTARTKKAEVAEHALSDGGAD